MDYNARGRAHYHPFRAPRASHARMNRHHNMGNWSRPPALLSESLLLPPAHQPPPMFGPRGATIPPRYYRPSSNQQGMHGQNFNTIEDNHWCETCDRGFRTESMLENHKKEHQRCNIDGCTFIAHPKVITKHIQMQHSSGLFSKIAKLNDPEEINKWREERRKKFPTKANIEKKDAEVLEKIERGEKMGLKKTKFPDNRNQTNCTNGSRKRPGIRKRPRKIEKSCPKAEPKHELPAFTGIRDLIVENDSKDDDDVTDTKFVIDDEIDEFVENDTAEFRVCGAINRLIADYKSSGEEDSDSNQNNAIRSVHKPEISKVNSNICKESKEITNNLAEITSKTDIINHVKTNENEEDSGPEEVKTLKTKEEIEINVNTIHNPMSSINVVNTSDIATKKQMGKPFKHNANLKKKLPSTLLQKLLADEIKHERNVTLQCIRYIIKNNYFNK